MATAKKKTTDTHFYGTGRRKTAIARVFIKPGSGKIMINQQTLENYFGKDSAWEIIVKQPLVTVDALNQFDTYITVKGGGVGGQAGAISHGLARALAQYDEQKNPQARPGSAMTTMPTTKKATNDADSEKAGAADQGPLTWRKLLRRKGLITADARRVERKKVGLHKARKRPQFSKR